MTRGRRGGQAGGRNGRHTWKVWVRAAGKSRTKKRVEVTIGLGCAA